MEGKSLKGVAACVCAVLVIGTQFAAGVQIPSRRALGDSIDSDLLDAQHCPSGNQDLARWLTAHSQQKDHLLPRTANTFEEFLVELKDTIDANILEDRPINYIMSDAAPFKPTCSGDWMEFGVYTGDTINMAARARRSVCGDFCSPVFGFDTFTGLPEAWVRDDSDPDLGVDGQGTFNLEGKFPHVEPNVQLIKGVFRDMLPLFELQHQQHVGKRAVSFLHIDCDLYNGTVDVLSLLNNRIAVGTVLVFDELINYNNYREHEVKALWEWLQESGAKLATLGVLGPLGDNSYSMELNVNQPNGEHPWFQQSVAFVVAEAPRPNTPPLMAGFQTPQQASQEPKPHADQNDANAEHKIKDATERDVYPIEIEKHTETERSVQEPAQAGPEDLDDHPVIADESALKEELAARTTPQLDKTEIAVSDIESIIPLNELEEDPEGEVPQDQGQKNKRPRPLKLDVQQPADSAANLERQPEGVASDGKAHHRDSTESTENGDPAFTAALTERRRQQREANEGLNTEVVDDAAEYLAKIEEQKRQQREADNGGAVSAQIADVKNDAEKDAASLKAKEAAEYLAELEERKRQQEEADLGAHVASVQDKARQKRKLRKHRSTLDEDSLDTLSGLQ